MPALHPFRTDPRRLPQKPDGASVTSMRRYRASLRWRQALQETRTFLQQNTRWFYMLGVPIAVFAVLGLVALLYNNPSHRSGRSVPSPSASAEHAYPLVHSLRVDGKPFQMNGNYLSIDGHLYRVEPSDISSPRSLTPVLLGIVLWQDWQGYEPITLPRGVEVSVAHHKVVYEASQVSLSVPDQNPQ